MNNRVKFIVNALVAVAIIFWVGVYAVWQPQPTTTQAESIDDIRQELATVTAEKERWEGLAEYWQDQAYASEVQRLKLVPPPTNDLSLPSDLGMCEYDPKTQQWISVKKD